MINIQNLSLYAGQFAFHNLNLDLPTGAYGVLMGQTGSGKTTLLEAICGLRPIAAGRITLAGNDVTNLPAADRGIGYVPQDRALFATMTVRQHLAFALVIRKTARTTIETRVAQLANMLNITPLLDRGVRNLSGGEAQRVALGRALSHQPALLLLDEPLSALDDQTRDQMIQLLRTIQKETGVTVLHVTHSTSEAAKLAHRLFILQNGQITTQGANA